MPTTYLIGLLLLLQVAGCAVSRTEPVSDTLQGGTVVVERLPPVMQEPGAAERPLSIDTPGGTVIIERLPPLPEVVPEVPVAAAPPAAVTAAPVIITPAVTTAPAKVAPVPPRAPPVQKPPVAAAAPAATQAPALALSALEQRLKDTDAIGVFTKIALKNQVDDLLNRAKSYHQSNGNPTLAQLRQSYDQLLAKIHGLLKDGDPALAGAIVGSREAIWGVITDPVRFAKL